MGWAGIEVAGSNEGVVMSPIMTIAVCLDVVSKSVKVAPDSTEATKDAD